MKRQNSGIRRVSSGPLRGRGGGGEISGNQGSNPLRDQQPCTSRAQPRYNERMSPVKTGGRQPVPRTTTANPIDTIMAGMQLPPAVSAAAAKKKLKQEQLDDNKSESATSADSLPRVPPPTDGGRLLTIELVSAHNHRQQHLQNAASAQQSQAGGALFASTTLTPSHSTNKLLTDPVLSSSVSAAGGSNTDLMAFLLETKMRTGRIDSSTELMQQELTRLEEWQRRNEEPTVDLGVRNVEEELNLQFTLGDGGDAKSARIEEMNEPAPVEPTAWFPGISGAADGHSVDDNDDFGYADLADFERGLMEKEETQATSQQPRHGQKQTGTPVEFNVATTSQGTTSASTRKRRGPCTPPGSPPGKVLQLPPRALAGDKTADCTQDTLHSLIDLRPPKLDSGAQEHKRTKFSRVMVTMNMDGSRQQSKHVQDAHVHAQTTRDKDIRKQPCVIPLQTVTDSNSSVCSGCSASSCAANETQQQPIVKRSARRKKESAEESNASAAETDEMMVQRLAAMANVDASQLRTCLNPEMLTMLRTVNPEIVLSTISSILQSVAQVVNAKKQHRRRAKPDSEDKMQQLENDKTSSIEMELDSQSECEAAAIEDNDPTVAAAATNQHPPIPPTGYPPNLPPRPPCMPAAPLRAPYPGLHAPRMGGPPAPPIRPPPLRPPPVMMLIPPEEHMRQFMMQTAQLQHSMGMRPGVPVPRAFELAPRKGEDPLTAAIHLAPPPPPPEVKVEVDADQKEQLVKTETVMPEQGLKQKPPQPPPPMDTDIRPADQPFMSAKKRGPLINQAPPNVLDGVLTPSPPPQPPTPTTTTTATNVLLSQPPPPIPSMSMQPGSGANCRQPALTPGTGPAPAPRKPAGQPSIMGTLMHALGSPAARQPQPSVSSSASNNQLPFAMPVSSGSGLSVGGTASPSTSGTTIKLTIPTHLPPPSLSLSMPNQGTAAPAAPPPALSPVLLDRYGQPLPKPSWLPKGPSQDSDERRDHMSNGAGLLDQNVHAQTQALQRQVDVQRQMIASNEQQLLALRFGNTSAANNHSNTGPGPGPGPMGNPLMRFAPPPQQLPGPGASAGAANANGNGFASGNPNLMPIGVRPRMNSDSNNRNRNQPPMMGNMNLNLAGGQTQHPLSRHIPPAPPASAMLNVLNQAAAAMTRGSRPQMRPARPDAPWLRPPF